MSNRANKAAVTTAQKLQNSETATKPDSFYSRVWEGATGIVIAVTGKATGNIGDLFTKPTETESIPTITATYVSHRLDDVKGNWNILSPRTPDKDSNE